MPPRPKALRVADDGPDIREMLADWQLYIGQMSADTSRVARGNLTPGLPQNGA